MPRRRDLMDSFGVRVPVAVIPDRAVGALQDFEQSLWREVGLLSLAPADKGVRGRVVVTVITLAPLVLANTAVTIITAMKAVEDLN